MIINSRDSLMRAATGAQELELGQSNLPESDRLIGFYFISFSGNRCLLWRTVRIDTCFRSTR